jgi:HSP20 family molecular chaperone IbpA
MDPPPLPASAQQQQSSSKPKVYSVRMDTAYDAETHTMTAMLEMPGVKQEHLTLRLSTCSYNGVRQLSVSGTLHPPAELAALVNRPTVVEGSVRTFGHRKLLSERKYGMFQRAFPVPATTRVRTFLSLDLNLPLPSFPREPFMRDFNQTFSCPSFLCVISIRIA